MLAYFCVTALSLLFFNQYLCNFTHQLPFHNLQEIPERAEHQWTSLFRRETILYVIRTRFQIPVLVCIDVSFQVTYAQCWKAQNKEAAYPVYWIWQGRVDINVNFWETNYPKTIKPKSASRRKLFFKCASFCKLFQGMQWLIQVITVKTNCESMENSTWLEYLSPYMFENGPASIAN